MEKKGRMTDSWSPSKESLVSLSSSSPHVYHDLEVTLFRDYYQDPSRDTLVLSQAEWDRKFRSWCARSEKKWRAEHREDEVKFDPYTGMPKNPKPPTVIEKSPEWWDYFRTLDPALDSGVRVTMTDKKMEER